MRHIKTTKSSHSLELDGDELLMVLQGRGGDIVPDITYARNFSLQVKVPSGGDYSGMSLTVDGDLDFVATWEEEPQEEVEES